MCEPAEPQERPKSAFVRLPSRPLSARVEGWSVSRPTGIAQVLATSLREVHSDLPQELRCPEAAILRLAPGSRLRQCRSSRCCWRWVATKLLDECLCASGQATEMRKLLEEELGDSILEQFLGLETEHEALQTKLQNEVKALSAEQELRHSLEEQLAQMHKRVEEAEARAERKDEQARRAVAQKQKEEAVVQKLRDELERQAKNSPEVLRRRTAQAEAEVERIRAETEKTVEKYKKEMLAEREQKTNYFIKLKELQAIEALIAKKNAKKRRKK